MYDPSMRVLTILEILQAKGHVSATELAERLEVSNRTVQRYVARLQDLGIPVESTRGRGAEYTLKPGFHMQPLMFNNEEAFVITLGLTALQHLGLTALTPALNGVLAKLERATPIAIWQSTLAIGNALELEKNDWIEPVDAKTIIRIAEAIQASRELEIEYRNPNDEMSQRAIRPLGLARHREAWYVAAFCMLRKDYRLFRVNRILAAHETHVTFTRPAVFRLQEFVSESFQTIPMKWTTEVWLDTTLESFDYSLIPAQAVISEEHDGLVIRCGVNSLERYAALLLATGCKFVIRTPQALKDAFALVGKRALEDRIAQ